MNFLRRFLCLMIYSIWFGGFTFYIVIVVPVGTSVLGSAKSQGFITQQVTHHLNWICAVALVFLFWEIFSGSTRSNSIFRLAATTCCVLIGLLLIGLVWIHPILDQLLDVESRKILERPKFYQWHRLYLWLSTLQWLIAIVLGMILVRHWSPKFDPPEKPQASQ